MRLYLFRHADKELSISGNPPLSKKGLTQSKNLLDLVKNQALQRPEVLLSSPRTRAMQTFAEISRELNLPLQTRSELDERTRAESAEQFFNRVKTTLQHLENINRCAFVVTHFDWVEEAMIAIPSDVDLNQAQYLSWGPAHFMEFEIQDGIWQFLNFRSVPYDYS